MNTTPNTTGDYSTLATILQVCIHMGLEDAVRRNTPDSTRKVLKRLFGAYPGLQYYKAQTDAFRMAYRAGFDGWSIVRRARSQIAQPVNA